MKEVCLCHAASDWFKITELKSSGNHTRNSYLFFLFIFLWSTSQSFQVKFQRKKNVWLCLGCKAYLNSSVAVAISGYEIHAGDL